MLCNLWGYLVIPLFILYAISITTAHLFYLSENLIKQKFFFYKEIKNLLELNKISNRKSFIYARFCLITWMFVRCFLGLVIIYLILKNYYCY